MNPRWRFGLVEDVKSIARRAQKITAGLGGRQLFPSQAAAVICERAVNARPRVRSDEAKLRRNYEAIAVGSPRVARVSTQQATAIGAANLAAS